MDIIEYALKPNDVFSIQQLRKNYSLNRNFIFILEFKPTICGKNISNVDSLISCTPRLQYTKLLTHFTVDFDINKIFHD